MQNVPFARQRWRAWIETKQAMSVAGTQPGSPVSDGGRGLKPVDALPRVAVCAGSPVSDGGRGLKQIEVVGPGIQGKVRPSAMAGVD